MNIVWQRHKDYQSLIMVHDGTAGQMDPVAADFK